MDVRSETHDRNHSCFEVGLGEEKKRIEVVRKDRREADQHVERVDSIRLGFRACGADRGMAPSAGPGFSKISIKLLRLRTHVGRVQRCRPSGGADPQSPTPSRDAFAGVQIAEAEASGRGEERCDGADTGRDRREDGSGPRT